MDNVTLVLCVDRDDDLGRKAKVSGPIIGDTAVESAAVALGRVDPEDSDLNALFMALRVHRELSVKNKEVAVLTGCGGSELEADRRLVDQLTHVQKNMSVKDIIFVSDGTQDERILPILQSRFPIASVVSTVVKQSTQLESSYYVVKDFFHDLFSDPKNARVFLGLPAIALLIYAVFGSAGTQLIIGVMGIFLFIKGFFLERFIARIYSEVVLSLESKRSSFFLYAVAFLIFLGGSIQSIMSISVANQAPLEQVLLFLQRAIPYYYFSGVFSALGRLIRHSTQKTIGFFVFVSGIGLSLLYFLFHAIDLLLFRQLTFFATLEVLGVSTILAGGTLVLERVISKLYASKKA